ncbi:MAG: c-type cytochrome [Gemmatimonadales bacterium]
MGLRALTAGTARARASAFCAAVLALAACSGGAPGSSPGSAPDRGPPSVRYERHVSAGGIAPPGAELDNPFRGDARSAAEGALLFKSMNCDGCHSAGAEGAVGPSLISGRWRYGGADGEVFQSVYYGRPDGMPAFGGIVTPPLAWKIVTWLKSLPPPKDIPTESW